MQVNKAVFKILINNLQTDLPNISYYSINCRSWQYIANLEISKRSNIESLIWPITYDSDLDDFHEDDKNDDCTKSKYLSNRWHISDSMRSLPKLVLLFNDENETELRNIEQCNVWVIHSTTLVYC